MAQTAEEVLQQMIGQLVMELAVLTAKVQELTEQVNVGSTNNAPTG